jgi:hypothetical protein
VLLSLVVLKVLALHVPVTTFWPKRTNACQNQKILEGAIEHTSPVPVCLIVAIIGSIVLYRMDFILNHAVRNDGINKISPAALAKAGATETLTPQGEQRPATRKYTEEKTTAASRSPRHRGMAPTEWVICVPLASTVNRPLQAQLLRHQRPHWRKFLAFETSAL